MVVQSAYWLAGPYWDTKLYLQTVQNYSRKTKKRFVKSKIQTKKGIKIIEILDSILILWPPFIGFSRAGLHTLPHHW